MRLHLIFRNSLTVAVIFSPDDEESADVFIEYLQSAFPYVKIVTNLENYYSYDIYTRWQYIFDAEPCCFIVLISENFFQNAHSERELELATLGQAYKFPFVFLYIEPLDGLAKWFRQIKNRFSPNLQEHYAAHLASFHGYLKKQLISSIHESVKLYLNCQKGHSLK